MTIPDSNASRFLRDQCGMQQRRHERSTFEAHIQDLTGCVTGDSTLAIGGDRRYEHPHVLHMRERYQNK